MAIDVEIRKQLGTFCLDVHLKSASRRIGILGASGCGKSLTLKSIAGIERPDEGYVNINDRILLDTRKKIDLKPQQRRVGYLFQNYALFPTMTVEENIAAGLTGKKAEKMEKVHRMMERFQIRGLEKHLPGQLSGGKQQRVALARILVYEPDVILLDEPFSALDAHLRDHMLRELLELLEDYEGTAILVSHSRDEIYSFSEEVLIMENGKGICMGKTKELFDNPQWEVAARLTGCKNIVKVCKENGRFIVPDWGIALEGKIPEQIKSIGIRAHDFIPVWDEVPDNAIPVEEWNRVDCPFERKYFIKAKAGEEDICWFVQRDLYDEIDEKGMPKALIVPEEKILVLGTIIMP